MLRSLLLLACLCAAFDARAEWFRAETPYFVLQADAPEAEVRQMAAELESLDGVMRAAFGITTPPGRSKADILVFADVPTVRRHSGIEWFSGGLTVAGREGEVLLVARGTPGSEFDFDIRYPLYHEYAHSFMRRHLSRNYPGWYVEGFASFFETARLLETGHISIGQIPLGYEDILKTTPIAFAGIMSVDAHRGEEGPAPSTLYAQGWLLTHHLFAQGSRAGEIRTYLRTVAAGDSVAEPDKFFAGGIAGFDSDMATYFQGERKLFRNAAKVPDPAAIPVRPMREGEARFATLRLEDMQASRAEALAGSRSQRFKATCERYAKIKLVLDRFPDERGPQLLAGRTALSCGENGVADVLADRLLAAEPDDPALMAFKADALVIIARDDPRRMTPLLAKARELLRRGATIDPNDPALAVASYNALAADVGITLQTRKLLQRAIELNPDDLALRFMGVNNAMIDGDHKYAIGLLEPLANSPHDTGLRDAMIKLIAEIRKTRRR